MRNVIGIGIPGSPSTLASWKSALLQEMLSRADPSIAAEFQREESRLAPVKSQPTTRAFSKPALARLVRTNRESEIVAPLTSLSRRSRSLKSQLDTIAPGLSLDRSQITANVWK